MLVDIKLSRKHGSIYSSRFLAIQRWMLNVNRYYYQPADCFLPVPCPRVSRSEFWLSGSSANPLFGPKVAASYFRTKVHSCSAMRWLDPDTCNVWWWKQTHWILCYLPFNAVAKLLQKPSVCSCLSSLAVLWHACCFTPGGGMLFWGLLSAAPKLLGFGCSALGSLCAPIALDKATWASYTWVKSYQVCKLVFEGGFVIVLGTETTLAPTPVINFPCEFRLLPSGLCAPLAQFGGEITAGSLTHPFFCPAIFGWRLWGQGSVFLSFGQKLAQGQEQGSPSRQRRAVIITKA